MEDTTWLDNLKAGDQVAVYARPGGYRIREVARRTPSYGLIVLTNGDRYNRDGHKHGDGGSMNSPFPDPSRERLCPITDFVLTKIEHKKLVDAVLSELKELSLRLRGIFPADAVEPLEEPSNEQLAELLAVLKKL